MLQSTYPEELWGVEVTSKKAGEVSVPYGHMLRVSRVAIDTHVGKGRVGVKAVIDGKEIPLCTIDECGAHLEFVIPGSYSAKFVLSGGHTAKTKIFVTGTLSFEGEFAHKDPQEEEEEEEELVEDIPLKKRPKKEPVEKSVKKASCGADSDATIELESLPRLPSSWTQMTSAQKKEAVRRIHGLFL